MAVEWRWLDPIPDEVTWVGEGLHRWGLDAGSVIRPGFAAYARVFHPIETSDGRRRRWSEVAHEHRRVAHPEMQFHLIATPAGQAPVNFEHSDAGEVRWGSLPVPERRALLEILARYTLSPTCWIAVWEGWGCLDDPGVEARLRLPNRHYLVAEDPPDLAISSVCAPPGDQSASLWWPKDRTWLVATEIDLAWTYVGGPGALIDELVSSQVLEAVEIGLHHRPQADSDDLNAALNQPASP